MASIKKLDKKEYSKARLEAEAEKEGKVSPKKAVKEPVIKNKRMTIEETKLGVTIVFSKEICYKLGFKESDSTKDVTDYIKKKLGL